MSATLAERIDYLFRTNRSPRGRQYTYREVAAAVTGQNGVTFSAAYLWQLRTGVRDKPTMRHLEAIARFFSVSPSYFFDDELPEFQDTPVRLLAASRSATFRRVADALLQLSEESLNTILALACRLRQLELGLPSPSDLSPPSERDLETVVG